MNNINLYAQYVGRSKKVLKIKKVAKEKDKNLFERSELIFICG